MKKLFLILLIVSMVFAQNTTVYKIDKSQSSVASNFKTYLAALGSAKKSITIGEDVPITTNTTVQATVDLNNFVNGAKFIISAGCTLTVNNQSYDGNAQICDTSGVLIYAQGAISHVRSIWFGSSGNGLTDCAVAIRRALIAANGAPVKFSKGKYLINSPISLNGVTNPKIIGTGTEKGIGTIFYCKNITGYTFQLTSGTAPDAIKISGIDFDGSNGTHSSYTDCSSTWLGAFRTTIASGLGHVFIDNCLIERSKNAGAIGLNLGNTFFVEVNKCQFTYFPFGYAVQAAESFFSTTFSFNKCYFTYCRQAGYFSQNASLAFNDCVFESSLGAIYTLSVTNTHYNNCYFENLGYDISITGVKKPKSVKYITGDTMNTVLCDQYGQVTFTSCNFGSMVTFAASDTTTLRGWFEGHGNSSIYGGGGAAQFTGCRRSIGSDNHVPFFYNANASQRGGYKYIVNDGAELIGRGGIARYLRDVRKVDVGTCDLAIGGYGTNKTIAKIVNGKLIIGCDFGKTYTGRLYLPLYDIDTTGTDTVYGNYSVGDEVRLDSPSIYGYEKVIATQSGVDAPVWYAHTTALNEAITPTVTNGKYYICTVAGKTSNTEPTWTTTTGDTITDSLSKWVCKGNCVLWNYSSKIDQLHYIQIKSILTNTDTTFGYMPISIYEHHKWQMIISNSGNMESFFTVNIFRDNSGVITWNVEGDKRAIVPIIPNIVLYSGAYAFNVANETAYTCRITNTLVSKTPAPE